MLSGRMPPAHPDKDRSIKEIQHSLKVSESKTVVFKAEEAIQYKLVERD
jgi:hypothetical protein